MRIIDLKSGEESGIFTDKAVVALGNFDGVHLGHKKLLEETVFKARQENARSAVWSFDISTLQDKGHYFLMSEQDKLEAFRKIGIEYAFLEDYDLVREFSPEKFTGSYLPEKTGCVCAVCGFNFHYGYMAKGDPVQLASHMKSEGRETLVIDPVYIDGSVVSSSLIRTLITSGKMDRVPEFLGYRYYLEAPVVHGVGLGHKIGVPTVNQSFPDNKLIPCHGVYITSVTTEDGNYRSITNVGTRPTVGGINVDCETNIPGLDRDLYGKNIKVTFYNFLRKEIKFDNTDELSGQIKKDTMAMLDFYGNTTEF